MALIAVHLAQCRNHSGGDSVALRIVLRPSPRGSHPICLSEDKSVSNKSKENEEEEKTSL